MDAPKGRYSVIEKEGRLVVIDNGTGAPLPSSVAPPPGRSERGGGSPTGPVAAPGPNLVDRAAGLLVALAAKGFDPQGRAVIAWEWRENGKVKRWDALLDRAQQRTLGRVLLAWLAAVPLLVLFVLADLSLAGFALLLALPSSAWAFFALRRLYRQTNDPGRGG